MAVRRRCLRAGISGIIASTVLASAAMIISYLGSSGATVFTTLVLMTGITAAIPYRFSSLAQLKWRWIDHRTLETRPRWRPRSLGEPTVCLVSPAAATRFQGRPASLHRFSVMRP